MSFFNSETQPEQSTGPLEQQQQDTSTVPSPNIYSQYNNATGAFQNNMSQFGFPDMATQTQQYQSALQAFGYGYPGLKGQAGLFGMQSHLNGGLIYGKYSKILTPELFS